MKESVYRVTITNEDGKIRSTLQELNNLRMVRQKEFDLLTVLGDLLNVVTCDGSSPYPQDNYSFKPDYMNHPFFLDKAFRGKQLFQEPLCFRSFFFALNQLNEIITKNKRLSASEFEVLKQFLSLTFTFKIELREINPLYKLDYRVNPINQEKVFPYQYVPLSYNYDFSMEKIFVENRDTANRFIYSCSSMEDVIFSVLHYLVLFKYKFGKCNHCSNYFATQTLKQKYCNRKSPYKEYEHVDCEQAVRNIKQKCVRRMGHVCSNLNEFYEQDVSIIFNNVYEVYKKAVDECSSVKNLFMLDQFLSTDNVKKNWYKEENRLKPPHNKKRTTQSE
jgi:hypothetical protein